MQKKLAAAIAVFFNASGLRDELPGAVHYGILRPMCNLHMPLFRRICEFEKRFPGKIANSEALRKLPNLEAAIMAARELGRLLATAWPDGAETEVLVGDVIFPGMHSNAGTLQVRRGQASLLFAVCEDAGERGTEIWKEFTANDWAAEVIDVAELAFVKAWVRQTRSVQIKELEKTTGIKIPKENRDHIANIRQETEDGLRQLKEINPRSLYQNRMMKPSNQAEEAVVQDAVGYVLESPQNFHRHRSNVIEPR